MTTDSGKKPLIGHFEVWGTDECMNHNCTERITLFVANKKCISCDPESYTKESVQIPPCPNCERLEGELEHYQDRLHKSDIFALNVGDKIQRLQKQLEMCKEALEFYASATHMSLKDKDKEQLASGHYLQVGRKARECLAKLEKE